MRFKLALSLVVVLLGFPASARAVGRSVDAGSLGAAATSPTVVTLDDGRVLLAGGFQFAPPQLYDPATGTWTQGAGHRRRADPDGAVARAGALRWRTSTAQ